MQPWDSSSFFHIQLHPKPIDKQKVFGLQSFSSEQSAT
jgi:hypothetical protein